MSHGAYSGLGKLAMEIAEADVRELGQIEDDLLAGRKEEALAGMTKYFATHLKPKKPVDREKYESEDRDREKARA
jgi:hypothetical protein